VAKESELDRRHRLYCQTAGLVVADDLSSAPGPEARQWALISASLRQRRRARLIVRRGVWLAPAALALAVALGWGLFAGRARLTYATEGLKAAPIAGELTTFQTENGRLTFSDGSRIVLDGGTRGRIVVPNRPASVELVLDSGAADVDVVHRRNTRWTVTAGPFRVDVKGTHFQVAWAPRQRRFRLEMRRGEVAISSGSFAATLILRSGQILEVIDDQMSVRGIDDPWVVGAPPRMPADSLSVGAGIRVGSTTDFGTAPEKDDRMHKTGSHRITRPARLAAGAAVAGAIGLLASGSVAAPPSRHGSPVFIGEDGQLGGPMTGYAWVAAGSGATGVAPSPCNAQGCFKDTKGQLCTRGTLPPLQCTGEGTAGLSCNWDADWGAVIGLDTTAGRGAWLSGAPSSVSLAYHGGHGSYRLNAHVAGDPDSKQYCVDGYQSGQVVAAGMLKTACWSDSGVALDDFQRVDKLSLEILSTESPLAYNYCVTAIAVNGSAGPTTDEHVAIEQNGKLAGPMAGYAWVAGGAGTSFSVPSSCGPTGCFANREARLCAKGSIAPLECSGQGTPQLSCNWAADWGGMIGLNPNLARAAWGAAAPSTLALMFSGLPADYRLMAHVAGDPDGQSYCIDGYQSGQIVEPHQLKTSCWSDGGTPLPSFQTVDRIGLQIMAAERAVPIDVCLSDIATR
jgi:hypothetical protein